MPPDTSSSLFTKSTPPGPPLIGALLRVPWEAVRSRMLRRLHEAGFDDLAMPHLTVFQYPGPHGARPSELAARLGVSKQALNHLLGEVERLGYLERRPDPEDGRSRRIVVTERGWAAARELRAAVVEVERDWTRHLGPERFAQLRALLLDLNRIVTEAPAPPGPVPRGRAPAGRSRPRPGR